MLTRFERRYPKKIVVITDHSLNSWVKKQEDALEGVSGSSNLSPAKNAFLPLVGEALLHHFRWSPGVGTLHPEGESVEWWSGRKASPTVLGKEPLLLDPEFPKVSFLM